MAADGGKGKLQAMNNRGMACVVGRLRGCPFPALEKPGPPSRYTTVPPCQVQVMNKFLQKEKKKLTAGREQGPGGWRTIRTAHQKQTEPKGTPTPLLPARLHRTSLFSSQNMLEAHKVPTGRLYNSLVLTEAN